MGATTVISWAKSTFNPWMGCARVSEACRNCYAEAFVTKRMGYSGEPGKLPLLWGATGARKRTSVGNWKQPLRWERQAAETGEFWPVFCASLADVFEDRRDLDPWRLDLFRLIEATPHLTWLLLTKRPDRIGALLPVLLPRNVWLGTTVEDAGVARARVPALLGVPATVRFLSLEPQLEEIGASDLLGWSGPGGVSWLITGGESGPSARPYDPAWAERVIDIARKAGNVAPFVKQLGQRWARENGAASRHGADPAEWPAHLRVQEFPGRMVQP